MQDARESGECGERAEKAHANTPREVDPDTQSRMADLTLRPRRSCCSISGGSLQDVIGRMADEHVRLESHVPLLCLTPQALEEFFIMTCRQLDRRLRLDLGRRPSG